MLGRTRPIFDGVCLGVKNLGDISNWNQKYLLEESNNDQKEQDRQEERNILRSVSF